MDLLYSLFMLFLVAMIPFIEAQFAAPVAVLLGLPLLPVIIIAFLGNFLSLFITIWFVYGIKDAAQKRKALKAGEEVEEASKGFISKRKKRANRIWEKYGMPGLAIIGMFFIGGHITALVACSFTGNRMRVTLWMALSILIWGGGFGIAAYFGFDLISDHPWSGILDPNA